MKKLKKDGVLTKLDESEEINACSIEVDVDVDGRIEKWLVMFKTKHITIRRRLSRLAAQRRVLAARFATRFPRAYVYQAMRITGAGDPRKTMAQTLDAS